MATPIHTGRYRSRVDSRAVTEVSGARSVVVMASSHRRSSIWSLALALIVVNMADTIAV